VPVAVVASGLPAARWCFVGFLPRKRGQRERLLADATETLVAFESPKRLPATLDMLAQNDPNRPVAVCRELTKLHEEVARGSAAELAKRYRERPPKGEVVLVVGPATQSLARGPVHLEASM
jgi:16S rRNA (cytidine1402-2'-O)-methyltransferase